MIRDFTKHALESNELFIFAANLIAEWIATAVRRAALSTVDAMHEPTAELAFRKEMAILVEDFFNKFPADSYCGFDNRRKRPRDEIDSECADHGGADSAMRVMREQCAESWLLFRAVVLFGRCRQTALSSLECRVRDRSGNIVSEVFFSERGWLLVLSSIEYHIVSVSVTSPMAIPIKETVNIADKAKRWEKAKPFLDLFYKDIDTSAVSESHVERRIARFTQFGQSNNEDGNLFSKYDSHYLVLLPVLSRRVNWTDAKGNCHQAFPHSCLSNSVVEVSFATGEALKSCDDGFVCKSSINVSLVAVRDISSVCGNFMPGTSITVSRIQMHTSESGGVSPVSSGEGEYLQSAYTARMAALQSIFGNSGIYTCPCMLCTFERFKFSSDSSKLVDLTFLDESLSNFEISQSLSDPKSSFWTEDKPLIPPLLPRIDPFPNFVSEEALFTIGEHYMQNARYRDAVHAYYVLVLLMHANYEGTKHQGQRFDATAYFHLGSALLDAGDSRNAFNAWALGYGMDPCNKLLIDQHRKDISFLYVVCKSSKVKCEQNSVRDVCSSVCTDMVRNFKLFSANNPSQCNFLSTWDTLYRSSVVCCDITADFISYGLGIYGTTTQAIGISSEEADCIIRLTEDYVRALVDIVGEDGSITRKPRGWTTSRHYDAPTTDIPVHAISEVLNIFNKCALTKLGPMLYTLVVGERKIKENMYMYINDAFVVKYEVPPEGSISPGQRFLPIHADQSHYSFTIALNDSTEYSDGGTYFVDLKRSLKVEKGHCLMFPGALQHGGDPITKGVRYILAVFAFISSEKVNFDSNTAAMPFLNTYGSRQERPLLLHPSSSYEATAIADCAPATFSFDFSNF